MCVSEVLKHKYNLASIIAKGQENLRISDTDTTVYVKKLTLRSKNQPTVYHIYINGQEHLYVARAFCA